MFTKTGSALPSSQPLTVMMYKNRDDGNQIFVLLESAVDLSPKELLVESDYGVHV